MRIELHVFIHNSADDAISAKLDKLMALVTKEENLVMSKIDDLTAAVTAEKTVEDSAVALLNGIAAQLQTALASSTPDVAVQSVIDSIKSNTDSLSAAVTANTPTPPAP